MLLGCHLGLLALADPAAHLGATLGALALGQLGLLLLLPGRDSAAAPTPGERDSAAARLGLARLLGTAAVLRLVLVPLAPSLSDDAARYLWDGHLVLEGLDPWARPPNHPDLAALRVGSFARVPHGAVATVYPPAAMALFSIAAALPAPLLSLRLLLVAADLLTCWLLARIAVRRSLPGSRVAWYAWNPLVSLEVAAGAHVDALAGLGVALAVAGVVGARGRGGRRDDPASESGPAAPDPLTPPAVVPRRRFALAWGAVLGMVLAVLAKLWPLALLPGLARASRRVAALVLPVVLLVVLGLLPMLRSGVPSGLTTYARAWEFAGPLYEPGWRLLAELEADRWVKRGLDRAEAWSGRHDGLDPLYPYVYPQLLARVGIAAVAAVALLRLGAQRSAQGRPLDPLRLTLAGTGWILLAAPTVYPWYLLAVLPWAALAGREGRAWRLAAMLAPASYLASRGGVALWPWVWMLCWLPPAVVWIATRQRSARQAG